MFSSMLKKPGPRRRSLPVVPRVPTAGLVKAVPSKYGVLGSWPPRIWTTGLICDAVCPWPPAFTELPEPMVNGRPLNRLRVPPIWNPPAIYAITPWLRSLCPLPNGNW